LWTLGCPLQLFSYGLPSLNPDAGAFKWRYIAKGRISAFFLKQFCWLYRQESSQIFKNGKPESSLYSRGKRRRGRIRGGTEKVRIERLQAEQRLRPMQKQKERWGARINFRSNGLQEKKIQASRKAALR